MKKFWQKSAVIAEVIFILIICIASAGVISYISKPEKFMEQNDVAAVSPTPASQTPTGTPIPIPTPTPEPTPIVATLVSAGDCVMHESVQQSGKIKGEDRYDYSAIFEPLRPYLKSAHYSLISFESAATNNRKDYTSYPLFNCPPEIFDAFKGVGFDLVNNSNNHQLDRKVKGMLETRENIWKAGLEVLGAYDGEEPRYLIKDLNGIKVGIMAYTYSCNLNENALTKEQQHRHLALFDEPRMEQEIKELEEKVDITVVAMHWGIEYTQKPNDQQKKLAQKLIKWGADVILGSHPHVVQPSEIVEVDGEAKYIIYSMGNFLSNQRRGAGGNPTTHKELCEDSMLVNVEFMKDPKTQKTVINKVTHIPTWLWRYTEGDRYQFKIIPVPELDYYKNNEYSKEVLDLAYESYERTMKLVQDYVRE